MLVTPHDGQQIWLILISQEVYVGRTRKIFLFYIIIILVTIATKKLIFKPKWYNESTEIAQIQSNITHNFPPS